MIFFYNLEDFSNIFYFISYRSIKLPIDLHYRPLEQTSNLASEFYFFSKVLAFLNDILTLACGSGQNIIQKGSNLLEKVKCPAKILVCPAGL